MPETKIRVLVTDDSALMRNLISRMLEQDSEIEVIGRAMNGAFALRKIESMDPDLVVLDLEMPEMNGVEFLKRRRELGFEVPVIILSSIARKGAEVTMEALNLGASDFVTKPSGSVSQDIQIVGEQLLALIKVYGGRYARRPDRPKLATATEAPPLVSQERSSAPPPEPKPPRRESKRVHPKLEILAIGISTGGPNALRALFQGIPGDFPWPIVVVQHMPAGFTAEFARSLGRVCALEVKEAAEGDLVKPGRALICPGDHHLTLERKSLATIVHLNQDAPVNGHRPSAGVLFKSVAQAYREKAVGLIMTGMGRDGSAEIGEIFQAGGLTIGQDEASCIVYGMPRVADELGHLELVLPLADLAPTLDRFARESN